MTFVQVSAGRRVWAVATVAALTGTTALVAAPAPARAASGTPTASAAVVAPSSSVRLTGGVGLTDDAVYGETATGIVTVPRAGSTADWSPVTVEGAPLTGHLLGAEGSALLVADLDGKADTLAWRTDDDTWSTRSVPTGTSLGHGGLYATLPSTQPFPGSIDISTDVVDVATGTVVFTHVGYGSADPVAITGTTLWRSSVFHDDQTTAWDVVSGA
jgi:cytochrome c5